MLSYIHLARSVLSWQIKIARVHVHKTRHAYRLNRMNATKYRSIGARGRDPVIESSVRKQDAHDTRSPVFSPCLFLQRRVSPSSRSQIIRRVRVKSLISSHPASPYLRSRRLNIRFLSPVSFLPRRFSSHSRERKSRQKAPGIKLYGRFAEVESKSRVQKERKDWAGETNNSGDGKRMANRVTRKERPTFFLRPVIQKQREWFVSSASTLALFVSFIRLPSPRDYARRLFSISWRRPMAE